MTVKNHNQKYLQFRREYPFFEYQSYSFIIRNDQLIIKYSFNLSNKVEFTPIIKIPLKPFHILDSLSNSDIDNFIFHIGMVELVSYWKTACSPIVIIPHELDSEQIKWWKKLYFLGLGEFFYVNGISADIESFMTIESKGSHLSPSNRELNSNKVLVPVGGGKDSVVSLEVLRTSHIDIIPMILNPREASINTIETAGYSMGDSQIIYRTIDERLLELNKQGFLNGHTPFSALLAFVGALSCLMSGLSYIALSNESSANESTVPDSKINHQYSKSFEFESDFNWYVKKYLNNDISYFSLLRPVNELQIAKLFSGFTQYHNSFRSCNVGSKTDSWCGKCPKCLFTYIMLSPFIQEDKLIELFGKNLYSDINLVDILDELTGKAEVKPFECVGTPDEVMAAIHVYLKNKSTLKPLLVNIERNTSNTRFDQLLSQYNTENLLPSEFDKILKKALND